MEKRIKEILIDIATKTYGKPPAYFKLIIMPEERKTFHGDYDTNTKIIRIFNLSRPIEHIVSTTIHELAHHIDFMKYGSSGHNKRFYGIFRDLLKTAIECGYIKYESIKNKKDSLDIKQMEKYYGELIAYYDEKKDTNKNKSIIKVKNCFDIKDYLKSKDFSYNSIEKTWDKVITNNNIEEVKKDILYQDNNVEIIVSDYNDIKMDANYYVIISKNTYEKKEVLSSNGYKYKGYGVKFLQKNGLEYKLKH